jgi:hypothetical protein
MSLNLSQVYVRYPDPKDAAELLRDLLGKSAPEASCIVASTGSPWLAVCGAGNEMPPGAGQALSRALEAQSVWYGLAGGSLAYRLLRWDLGRETEHLRVPEEIFAEPPAGKMPEYHDVEDELYKKLRGYGIPADYVYLFIEEVGVAGGSPGVPDAAAAREGAVGEFRHRVPHRHQDKARTLFDRYVEGEQSVTETLRLQGPYDEARAKRLLTVLETARRRRSLPDGWTLRYAAAAPGDEDLVARIAALHAKGRYGYEFGAA